MGLKGKGGQACPHKSEFAGTDWLGRLNASLIKSLTRSSVVLSVSHHNAAPACQRNPAFP